MTVLFVHGWRSVLPTPISYQIRCEKDGKDVVQVGGPALIASFSLKVENKELIDQDQWVAGEARSNGAQFTQLEDPDKSATVSFSISSNEGWTAADADVLRGQRRFDEVSFSNL